MLDEKSLSFLLELWRVLNRDEPQTADALLHPNITTTEDEVRSLPGGAMNSTSSGSDGASEAGPTNPLHTSRSDAHGEVLGLSLKPLVIVPPSADGYLVEGWDMAVVTEWIVARVNAVQGFNDQIVIDTLLRGIRPLAELPTPTANGAGSKQASPISKQQQQTSPTSAITAASALSDPTALQSHLDLLIDNGGGKQLVTALIDFLNSPASRTRSRSGSNGNSKAFNKENDPLALPDNVEAWCAADKGLCVALILLEVTEGVLLILQGPNQRGCALLQRPGALGLAPVPDVTSDMLTPLHGAWPCPEGALLLVGDALIVLRGDGTMKKILAIPISLVSLDLSWQESSGLTVVGIFDTSSKYAPQEAAAASGPIVHTWPPPETHQREIRRYTSIGGPKYTGWVSLGKVGPAACRLSLAPSGQRVAWCEPHCVPLVSATASSEPCATCGGGGYLFEHSTSVVGEFYASALDKKGGLDAQPVTEGAERCVAIKMASDGTGFAYLASHSTGGHGFSSEPLDLSLWWQVWEGGAPPVQLCLGGIAGRILAFGWAPPADDEEVATENENGEEETEVLPGLRLWVTTLRNNKPFTQLIDLQGAILGAFELPILGDGVVWLQDGRRVLITESSECFPSLWDGAALSTLPLPAGFGQIRATPEAWAASDGRRLVALSYDLPSTPHNAPLILQLHDPRDEQPMLSSRGGIACSGTVPLLPLLRMGYRIVSIECSPPVRSARTRSALAARALMTDVIVGLEQYLSAHHSVPLQERLEGKTGLAAEAAALEAKRMEVFGPIANGTKKSGPPPPVGVMGSGYGGLLALNAVAWSERFNACVVAGAPVSERWHDLESGACTALAANDLASDLAARESSRMAKPAAFAGSAAASEFELLSALSNAATLPPHRRAPVLLLYGDSDPSCHVSQAHVAYHAIRGRGPPDVRDGATPMAQLVLYPNDTSAPKLPAHRRDAARRTCSWFAQHLVEREEPVEDPLDLEEEEEDAGEDDAGEEEQSGEEEASTESQ